MDRTLAVGADTTPTAVSPPNCALFCHHIFSGSAICLFCPSLQKGLAPRHAYLPGGSTCRIGEAFPSQIFFYARSANYTRLNRMGEIVIPFFASDICRDGARASETTPPTRVWRECDWGAGSPILVLVHPMSLNPSLPMSRPPTLYSSVFKL